MSLRTMRAALLLALALILTPNAAQAFLGDLLFLPPQDNYQRLETPNFIVVYPKIYETEAKQSAPYLEEAHALLAPFFSYPPRRKTTIILTDNEDSANGVTSALGHQGIVLYLTAPDPYTSIGEYDHWLRNLIIHEYSHYVTLDQTRGFFEFARILFGDLMLPNHLWPSWLAEGIAVLAETEFTSKGRGNGAYFATITRDALSRSLLESRDFLYFDHIFGPHPDFPFGETAYYAGYHIVSELLNEYGTDAATRYTVESSFRFPYFLNGGLENIGGKSFRDLWRNWVDRERKRYQPEIGWLRSSGAPDPEFLTPEKDRALGARLSPQGKKLAYFKQSGHETSSLHLIDMKSREDEQLEKTVSGAGLAWENEDTLYFAKADFRTPFSFYSELYRYDLKHAKSEQLTHGERAKDPDYCVGGELVYTTQRGRFSELRALSLSTKEVRVLYQAPEHHHVSNPRCSHDGKTVYFAEHSTQPLETVKSITLHGSAKPERLFGGEGTGFSAIFPEPTEDGRIYFTRVRDRYFDLAEWNPKTRETKLVARSTGGYWLPRVSQGQMVVTYVSATGIRAGLVKSERLREKTASPPESARFNAQIPKARDLKAPELTISEPKSYSAIRTLAPRIWTPYLTLAEEQTQIGAGIMGWDDVDQIRYTLIAWYDSISRHAEGLLSTSLRLSTFRVGIGGSTEVTDYVVVGGGRRAYAEERIGTLALSRPIPAAFSRFEPTIYGQWARTRFGGDFGIVNFSPELRAGSRLVFENRNTFGYSLAPETGYRTQLEALRFFSDTDRAWKGLFRWDQLVPLFPRHSVLDLELHAAVATKPTFNIPESFVIVGGQGHSPDLDPPLRGYKRALFTRRAAVLQSEYRLPLAHFFRGFDTFPFFLRNLGAYAFYDAAVIQEESQRYTRPIGGVGGGLLLNTVLGYQAPLQLRLEYAHGFRRDRGGEDVVSLLTDL